MFCELRRPLAAIPLADYIKNSVIIAGGSTLLNGIVAIPAGYALRAVQVSRAVRHSSTRSWRRRCSPRSYLLLATFRMMFDFGLLNTYWSVIFVNATVALPFTVWMLTAYFSTIPREIEEAAILDNAGRWRMLFDHFYRSRCRAL